ncbi:hypothetical protein SAMN05216404_105163 [Nitrosospira multiformis]|uniref:Homeodomain-like domain-containing protein n=1 Tax=Nitrosospira multiformis TaxID=1231 RepID=A0A1H8HMK7_9PROT|nr:hypothetical protein [Nitrosospira multiformis]SEN56868.1 hypothetical protein SAMN05216404_105163 [Nitrosospira multiformis]
MENDANLKKKISFEKEQDSNISNLSDEEFQQSCQILTKVLATLPSKRQRELFGLLQILVEDGTSQKQQSSVRPIAEKIVATVCRDDHSSRPLPYQPERRISDRRRNDRRQSDQGKRLCNAGTPWTSEDIQILEIMAKQGIPHRRIALKLGRTSTAVEAKAKTLNIPLSDG